MKYLIAAFCLFAFTGCTSTRSMKDVQAYGEQKFIEEVLSVADGNPPPETLLRSFQPLKIEPHLNGAWLVYKTSGRYEEGIYVDRISVDDWGGSGMEMTRWSKNIGWSKEKIRK